MMILKTPAWSSPGSSSTTAYKLRLGSVAIDALAEHDASTGGLLAEMIRLVDQGGYGMVRTFFRMLPISYRERLGAPPASREEDENNRLQW